MITKGCFRKFTNFVTALRALAVSSGVEANAVMT
jgi:hypothetical protein